MIALLLGYRSGQYETYQEHWLFGVCFESEVALDREKQGVIDALSEFLSKKQIVENQTGDAEKLEPLSRTVLLVDASESLAEITKLDDALAPTYKAALEKLTAKQITSDRIEALKAEIIKLENSMYESLSTSPPPLLDLLDDRGEQP